MREPRAAGVLRARLQTGGLGWGNGITSHRLLFPTGSQIHEGSTTPSDGFLAREMPFASSGAAQSLCYGPGDDASCARRIRQSLHVILQPQVTQRAVCGTAVSRARAECSFEHGRTTQITLSHFSKPADIPATLSHRWNPQSWGALLNVGNTITQPSMLRLTWDTFTGRSYLCIPRKVKVIPANTECLHKAATAICACDPGG